VQPANYCTIKVAAESVCTVCGQRKSTGRGAAGQALVCYSYPFDAGGRGQIEAQPKFKDRANYERLLDTGRLPAGSLLREIQTSPRIGLPEVNSRAKPIILVIARLERFASEEPLSHVAIAAMVAKDERGRETVQGLTVVLGKFARFGIDAFGDQDLSRGLAGLSCTLCEGLRCLPETVKRFAAPDIDGNLGSILVLQSGLHNPSIQWFRSFEPALVADLPITRPGAL
jgi:hypothetical protein